jgi:hypothetical protein
MDLSTRVELRVGSTPIANSLTRNATDTLQGYLSPARALKDLRGTMISLARVSAGVITLLAASGAALAATVVYDGGAPNQYDAYYGDTRNEFTEAATIAVISGETSFNGMSWWGAYNPNTASASDTFTLSIYADVGGSVGTLLDTVTLGGGSRVATGQTVTSCCAEYEYTAMFSPLTLGPGSYFFALSDSPTTGGYWAWETTSGGPQAGGADYDQPTGTWLYHADENLAFNLTSTVPLPAAAWLLLSGLGGLGAFARRRAA